MESSREHLSNQTTVVSYTVYANNSGGSTSTSFTITINEPVANLGAIVDQTFTRDSALLTLSPAIQVGSCAWAIHPTLPAGLSMTNGVISERQPLTRLLQSLTPFANNSGGSDSETFTITINEPVANLGAIADQTFTRDSAITNIVPSNTGGAVATWSIHPTLPAGLTFSNGVISGTPTVNQTTAVTYTLYVNNSGGSDSETFTITINEPVANLGAIADQTFTVIQLSLTLLLLTLVVLWQLGNPSNLTFWTFLQRGYFRNSDRKPNHCCYLHAVCDNSGGSDSETFTITVNEPVANLGTIADQTFTVIPQSPTLLPATQVVQLQRAITQPYLPGYTNGVISGTPTVNQTTAVLIRCMQTILVDLTVKHSQLQLTNLRTWSDCDQSYTRGTAITDLVVTNTGGAVAI